jgi:hypothetical protein
MPKYGASFYTAISIAIFAAALKTVSIEKTAFSAIPKFPVATKVVANLDIIVAAAALHALIPIADVIVNAFAKTGAKN